MIECQSKLSPNDVRRICSDNGLIIQEKQWNLLEKWAILLQDLNKNVNLISRKGVDFLWEKQILSCLSLLILRKFSLSVEVCDFGTGGGFPGMVMAIVRPDLNLTLFESRSKKVKVVRKMIETLKIPNAQVVLGRGEELGKKSSWFKRFPCITSRAVGSLEDMDRWTKDMRSEKSVLHLFKGGDITEEINALLKKKPGLKINSSLINLIGYNKFAENKKFLISLRFDID